MKARIRALLNVVRGRPTIYRARIEHVGRVYVGQPGLRVEDSTFPLRNLAIGKDACVETQA